MNFIGVDLHKKSITVGVMDERRKVLAPLRNSMSQPRNSETCWSFPSCGQTTRYQ